MGCKVKNADVQNLFLRKPELFSNRKLPVKTIYWLSRLEREATKCLQVIEEERIKLLENMAESDNGGNPTKISLPDGRMTYKLPPENQAKINKMMEELFNIEIELPIDKIRIDIDQIEGSISANEMNILFPFVEFVLKDEVQT